MSTLQPCMSLPSISPARSTGPPRLPHPPRLHRPRGLPATTAPSLPALYVGPVSWDADAAAAVVQLPFFRRGPIRVAAIALARKRGLDRVTAALMAEALGTR